MARAKLEQGEELLWCLSLMRIASPPMLELGLWLRLSFRFFFMVMVSVVVAAEQKTQSVPREKLTMYRENILFLRNVYCFPSSKPDRPLTFVGESFLDSPLFFLILSSVCSVLSPRFVQNSD